MDMILKAIAFLLIGSLTVVSVALTVMVTHYAIRVGDALIHRWLAVILDKLGIDSDGSDW